MDKKEIAKLISDVVYKSDEGMRKYFEKRTFKVIKLEEGGLLDFEKPSVKTRFCYSFDELRPDSLGECFEQCDSVKNEYKVFLAENTYEIKKRVDALKKILERNGEGDEFVWIVPTYRDYGKDERFVSYSYGRQNKISSYWKEAERASIEDVKKILEVEEELLKYVEKKCETYWKRYGGSKLRVWSYSIND